MGLLKLIIAALVIGAVGVIVNEWRKARKKEQLVSDLYEELEDINAGMDRAEVKNDVLAAREILAKKRAEIAEREANAWCVTETPDTTVEAPKNVDISEGGATAPKKRAAPKKKVVKKKAAPKKKSTAKKK